MGKGVYAGVLGASLAVYWLVLSGIYDKGLLLIFGALSVFAVVALAERMRIMDAESIPILRLFPVLSYWVWLGGEITKANIVVARTVLRADLDVTPRLIRVPAPQRNDFSRTIFANSITLTPGTVTVDIGDDEFIVHALTDELADIGAFEDMSARVIRAAEGR